MKTEDLVKLGLDEETAKKVAEASAEELKGFIPKARFDEVNEAKKASEETVKERDKQLAELSKAAGTSEELKKQIEALQAENAQKTAEHEATLKQLKIDAAIKDELTAAGITGDAKMKMVKALLDLNNPEIADGKINGLTEQLNKLKDADDTKGLFGVVQGGTQMKGIKPGESGEPKSAIDTLNAQLLEAQQKGNLAQVVSLRNQIHAEQSKNQ